MLPDIHVPIDNTPEGAAFQDVLVPPPSCGLKESER